MGTKKYVEWGFGFGESEYEVSFGLAPRNLELSHSAPETPEPFNSPFRARSPEHMLYLNSPQNLESVSQNLGSMVNFFDFRGGETTLFLTWHLPFAGLWCDGFLAYKSL